MLIGCLGDVVFEVSDQTVETINNVQWAGSVRYAVHQRHNDNALTEYMGREPDTMSFELILNQYLGPNPTDECIKIWNYERNAEPVPLYIGDRIFGKYRWNVVSHTMKMQTHDAKGNCTSAIVSVELQEYLKS